MADGAGLICGVDEAGRGPLAGPVYAAAVILDPARPIPGLKDSKKIPEPSRVRLAGEIRAHALAWSVAWATEEEIDRLNILRASLLAMRRAVLGLNPAAARGPDRRQPLSRAAHPRPRHRPGRRQRTLHFRRLHPGQDRTR
jgi:ribonuclease HII